MSQADYLERVARALVGRTSDPDPTRGLRVMSARVIGASAVGQSLEMEFTTPDGTVEIVAVSGLIELAESLGTEDPDALATHLLEELHERRYAAD